MGERPRRIYFWAGLGGGACGVDGQPDQLLPSGFAPEDFAQGGAGVRQALIEAGIRADLAQTGADGPVRFGQQDRQIQVQVDQQRLQGRGLSILQVNQALGSDNVNVPAGNITQQGHDWTVRLDNRHLAFLKDHKVENHLIFPAAGFVELVLEAGTQLFEGRSFVIEDFEIRKPLILPEPASFIRKNLPRVSVIRPSLTENAGAVATIESFNFPNIGFDPGVLKLVDCLDHQIRANLQIVGLLVPFDLIEL